MVLPFFLFPLFFLFIFCAFSFVKDLLFINSFILSCRTTAPDVSPGSSIDDQYSISSSSSIPASNVIHEGLGKRTTLKALAASALATERGEEEDSDAGNNNNEDVDPAVGTEDTESSKAEPVDVPASTASVCEAAEKDSETPTAAGPRIKHVCRKASVAQRQGSPAKFGSPSRLDDNEVEDVFDDDHGLATALTSAKTSLSQEDNSMEGSESSVEFCRLSALPKEEKDKVLEETAQG